MRHVGLRHVINRIRHQMSAVACWRRLVHGPRATSYIKSPTEYRNGPRSATTARQATQYTQVGDNSKSDCDTRRAKIMSREQGPAHRRPGNDPSCHAQGAGSRHNEKNMRIELPLRLLLPLLFEAYHTDGRGPSTSALAVLVDNLWVQDLVTSR